MTKRLTVNCKKPNGQRETYADLTAEEEAERVNAPAPVREPSLKDQIAKLHADVAALKAAARLA